MKNVVNITINGKPAEIQFPDNLLRDYFAAKALQMIVMNDVSSRPENFREHYSKGAYKWADAMLAAREKQP